LEMSESYFEWLVMVAVNLIHSDEVKMAIVITILMISGFGLLIGIAMLTFGLIEGLPIAIVCFLVGTYTIYRVRDHFD